MLLLRCEAPVFAANCYVLAVARGGPALVVDPGAGTARAVHRLLREHDLSVGAVLLTHGHPDHLWDAAEVAGDAPVHLAAPDLYRMADPAAPLGESLAPMFTALTDGPWQRPRRVEPLPPRCLGEGGAEVVPGMVVRAVPAPGHTEGSTVLLVRGPLDPAGFDPDTEAAAADDADEGADADPGEDTDPAEDRTLALTGDVLFAGTIGRADLPGADQRHMLATLRLLATALPPETVLLPGHGPATTLAQERRTNSYLREAMRLG